MKWLLAVACLAVVLILSLGYVLPNNLVANKVSAQATSAAKIYFVDIGQGAGTLIVSPTGKTMLVDGGPDNAGSSRIVPLLNTLGINKLDFTVLTHYHIDHDAGLKEVFQAGKGGAGTIAYDNGDGPTVIPPNLTGSTGVAYTNYKNAVNNSGASRQTITPGQVIDLGGGMRATCVIAGGKLLSGGGININNVDLNDESIGLLIEYNNFDFMISGDLGGGGISSARVTELESFVAQQVGDVDVVQLNHHGSSTSSNQRYLSALKAEVAVAQIGSTNTFGHPTDEVVNRYLNTPTTNGNTSPGTGTGTPGVGPTFYQIEQSPSASLGQGNSQQGIFAAAANQVGNGTILLQTDGTTNYSMTSFNDGGVRIAPSLNTYPLDNANNGITTNFGPTVVPSFSPEVPLATDSVTVNAQVFDREDPITSVTLNYSLNGVAQTPKTMTLTTNGIYQASIPPQPNGTRIDTSVSAVAGSKTTTYADGYFSGTTPISALRALNANGAPLYFGYTARVQGVVTAPTGVFNGSNINDDYVQDATGGINLIRTQRPPDNPASLVLGSTVEARGYIENRTGRLQLYIGPLVSFPSPSNLGVSNISTGPAPTPTIQTIGQLNANPESFEGQLIKIMNCTRVSGGIPSQPASLDAFITISDGTGNFTIKVDRDSDVPGFGNLPATFDVVGIIQQDDFFRPFDGGYNITPRNRADLGGTAVGATLQTIAEVRTDTVDNTDGNPPADFIPDQLNQTVKVRGVVTSIDFRGGNGIEYYIQDTTGGIDIFNSTTNFGPFSIGDNLEVIGAVKQFNGLTELDPGTNLSNVTVLPSGTLPAVSPQTVTLSQLADNGVGEPLEGRLIRVLNATITTGGGTATANSNVTISDGTGSVIMRIDGDTNIVGTTLPTGAFTLTAMASQFDSSDPFDSGYQLLPRSTADLVGGAAVITTSPTTVDFGTVSIGGSSSMMVTITNNSASSVTLTTPFTISGTDLTQFSVGSPGTTSLSAGGSTTVSTSFSPTSSGTKSAMLTIQTSSGNMATVALTGITPGGGGGGGGIVISEFRFRGPSGGNDEFVEIYNNSDNPIDISGWKLMGSSNTAPTGVRATVRPNTILPGRQHYLFVNTAASGYSGTVAGNISYTTGVGDNGGIAITDAANTIMDQVGITTTGTAYREGTALATQLTTNTDRGYERKPGGASVTLQDTNDNATDFQLTTPSNPQNIVLTGAPLSINFGTAVIGGSNNTSVTLTNNLVSAITLTTPFTISGADANQFSVGTPGTTSLASAATTTVSVSFSPTSTGTKSAMLIITSSSAGTLTIPLTGIAANGINVSPTTLNFGSVSTSGSLSLPVTISNPDTTTVTLTPPFSITGTNADQFSVGSPTTSTLAQNGTATVMVTFSPTSTGSKTATLTITSANGGNRIVTLNGTGVTQQTPVITWNNPTDITFGTALSSTQLNATANTPGTFVYTPAAGTVLNAGNGQTLSVTFTPNDTVNFSTATKTVLINVLPASTTTQVTSNLNPSTVGQSVTFTATVTSVVTPSGVVTFKDGSNLLGSSNLNGSGAATFSTSALTIGGHSIQAFYTPDTGNFSPSSSNTLVQGVNAGNSASFSVVAPASTNVQSPFTITVIAKDSSGNTATNYQGTVHFTSSDAQAVLPSDYTFVAGDSGVHTFSVTLKTVGSQTIAATDTVSSAITGSATVSVTLGGGGNGGNGLKFVFTTPANVFSGQPFTTSVTVQDSNNVIVTNYHGTINFLSSDPNAILPANYTFTTADRGRHTFTNLKLVTAGGQTISATEVGNSNNFGTSATIPVKAGNTATTITRSSPSSVFGQSVTFTATVRATSPATGTPTGTVDFNDGATLLATVPVAPNGTAVYTTNSLSVGTHPIKAVYSGDSSFNTSTSALANQIVSKATTKVLLTSDVNPSSFGSPVTFTATITVNTPGGGIPDSGTVTFKRGAVVLGTATVDSSGTATFTTSTLGSGSNTITAVYSGNANYNASPAASIVQKVQ